MPIISLVLVVMSAIRELVGTGAIGATQFFPAEYSVMMLTLPVGGFLTLACVIAAMQYFLSKSKNKQTEKKEEVEK